MKQFFTNLRQTAVAGFFFLFPLYVVFIVIFKAWTSLTSVGSKLASMFGVKTVLGVGGATLFSSLIIIAIWLLCGLLVRVSFVGAFSRTLERTISSLIPGYASYRAIAEEKIAHKTKILPYACALLTQGDCQHPAFVVDKDNDGNFVLFLPDIPDCASRKPQNVLRGRELYFLILLRCPFLSRCSSPPCPRLSVRARPFSWRTWLCATKSACFSVPREDAPG